MYYKLKIYFHLEHTPSHHTLECIEDQLNCTLESLEIEGYIEVDHSICSHTSPILED